MPEPDPIANPRGFIFQDPQGTRWPRLRLVLFAWALIVAAAVVWFFQVLLVRPEVRIPQSIRTLKGQLKTAAQHSALATTDPNEMNWQKFYEQSQASQERLARIRAQLKKVEKPKGEIRLGLYVDWDPNSFASLEEHAGSLTHLAPEWFSLVDTDSKFQIDAEPRVSTFAASRGLAVMPILRNLSGNDWQPEAVENLAKGPADKRSRFISDLVAALRKTKAAGVILDWQQLDPNYRDDYSDFLAQIADALHEVHLELWFMVTMGEEFEIFDIEALESAVDRFIAVLHDENSDTDAPGPIASQTWLEGWLKVIAKKNAAGEFPYGEPDQWIGLLGGYAYDWNTTTKKTETISFKDAMSRASYAGVDRDGHVVKVEAPSYNGEYDYSEPGGEHSVTFLDAISFYNQLRVLRGAGLGGIGVSRLGTEDPQVWDVLDAKGPPTSAARKALGTLRAGQTITHVGRGEIVTVDDTRDDGTRIVEIDPDRSLRATYIDFPTYPILYHEGAGGPHDVAITFDDGPDSKWTPKILEILRARGVKAAFFVTGRNCEANPGLLLRILQEGHEIGNHTFSHGNLATMSPEMMRLELNATQRLIESITGHSTTLFRPPYNSDSNPTDIAELAPLKFAQEQLGYTVVLEKVDPQDWARPGANVILQRVKELRSEGNIVLLHDAGGDRSQTVEALPRIIDYLHARGDRIVPLSELLEIPRDQLMPVVSGQQPLERIVAGTGFRLWHAIIEFFWAFMIFATGLVFIRTMIVAWLAHRHHGAEQKPEVRSQKSEVFAPPLSVIIAAYNEAKVIAKTLRSVLETDYTGEFEVIVVDDGSKDDTSAEVEHLAAIDGRVRLLRQANGGKASALDRGLAQARHGIVVFLDADTIFERGTLAAIVQPLAKPLVGAVSGHARVGNLRTFIAKCQSLEYICGFNLDRRAYTEWNCITVVPGAVSALRKTAIDVAGGFPHDTLAEDTDLTLTLHRLGYRIEYAPDAVAWTEAPETFATLARQRARWAFGTMQCLWKHRDLVFDPRFGALGWFSLPGVWFFQILLVAIAPLVDGVLLYSLIFGHAAAIWYYFAAFLVMDIFLALLACRIEGEPAIRALIIVPMRFVYRPLLSWVIWKSIIRALKGALVGWGKLERTSGPEQGMKKRGTRNAECGIAAALLLLVSGCDRANVAPPSDPRGGFQHPRLAIPERGIYQGAYMDWGEREDAVTLEGIDQFETMVGKHQAIVASSSYWGEQTFPDENVRLIARHGSIPLIFWSPWDRPYAEGRGPDKYSLTSIIAGEHDAYIDMWAEHARDFDYPIVVSFANEMNGSWFPWSGLLYGGSKEIPGTKPPLYEGPETFKKAYRHVVDRARAKGATNVQWVLHLMDYSMPQEDWNLAAQYYPGPEYCDWLGFSLYGSQFPSDGEWAPFFPLFDWPYTELTLLDPKKPIMVCEWGVAELPHLGSKPDWIRDGFRVMKDPKFPRLKACVFWHERWQNSEGGDAGKYSNLRVNSTPEALEAYRQSVADPFYLSHPVLKEEGR